MRSIKIPGVAMVSVLVVGALVSSPAFANEAPGWVVDEVFLEPSQIENLTATSTTTATFETPTLGLSFTSPSGKCTATGSIQSAEAESEGPGIASGTVLTCTEVSVKGAAKCTVHSSGQSAGTFATNTLSGKLVWLEKTGNQAGLILKPSSGTELVNAIVEGPGCPLAGTYPVTKEVIGKFSPVEEEVVTAKASFPSTAILKWWNNEETRKEIALEQLRTKAQLSKLVVEFGIELAGGKKVGVAGLANTKLCEEAPNPFFKFGCAPGKTYGVSEIKGSDEPPAQPAVTIELRPAPIRTITCFSSKLAAATTAAAAEPLPIGNFSLTFAGCATETNVMCGTAEMTNKPVNGTLKRHPFFAGMGFLKVPLTVRLTCGGVVECQYKTAEFTFLFAGAEVASIQSSGLLNHDAGAVENEVGCRPEAKLTTNYAVSKPLPVWVTR